MSALKCALRCRFSWCRLPVATASVFPAVLEPQLCTLVEQPPSGADWLHEIKYDGWRLLARKQGDDVRLYTRGGVEWSQRLPRLVDAIRGRLRFEGLVEFGLSRISDLRERLVELATTESPFVEKLRDNHRRFWLRPDVTLEIRSLPRRPGRPLRHATALRASCQS